MKYNLFINMGMYSYKLECIQFLIFNNKDKNITY